MGTSARAFLKGGAEHYVRGRGYIKKSEDLERVVLAAFDGTPVTVRDVGRVRLGPAERRGLADLDGEGEVVGGAVIVRPGVNALDVIESVKARIESLRGTLPAGVDIVPTYDRSQLIRRSIATLQRTLLEELLVVGLVILAFLLHVRSTLVPMLLLPVAILLAFIPMRLMGLTANIMSLGGIAIAVGAMVDAAIIVVENVHKRLEAWEVAGRPGSRADVVTCALQEVGRPIFFSLLVITVGFLPVFTLEGTEGRLFAPLAFTKTFAMAFAALLSVTLFQPLPRHSSVVEFEAKRKTPWLAVWLMRMRLSATSRCAFRRLSLSPPFCSWPQPCPSPSRWEASSCRPSMRAPFSTCPFQYQE
jgi:copper/silver efflux system protein